MQRIDTTTAVANLFGAGKAGFQDGNAITGVASTQLDAAFFNAIQEEIAELIEATGAPLAPGTYNQLATAIDAMIVAAAPAGKEADGWQKLPSGLIVQWGSQSFGATTAGSTYTTPITLPIVYPTQASIVVGSPQTNEPSLVQVGTGSATTAGFDLYTFTNTNFIAGSLIVDWLSFGW